MDELKKLENQNFHQYVWAMDELVQSGKYKNWKEITPFVNKELFGDDESQYRDESSYRKPCKYARDYFEAGVFGNGEDEYLKKFIQFTVHLNIGNISEEITNTAFPAFAKSLITQ